MQANLRNRALRATPPTRHRTWLRAGGVRPPRVVWSLIGVLLVTALGCSQDETTDPVTDPGTIDLLRRRPDFALVQSGRILPHEEGSFGEVDRGGWADWVAEGPSDEPIVWTMERKSRLLLAAGPPRDRDLRVRLLAPRASLLPDDPLPEDEDPASAEEDPESEEETGPVKVRIRLNGQELARVELSGELTDYEVFAPAPVWRQGDNLLEFEVSRMSPGGGGYWHGFALASVHFGQAIEVECFPDSEELSLGPDGGVAYSFLANGDSRLLIHGLVSADGSEDRAGHLDVRLRRVEVESGRATPVYEEPLRIDAVDGSLTAALPLPKLDDDILSVQLDWKTEGAAPLVIDRLDWVENEPRERVPIFFVSVDTLSARNMSLYGYARKTTPNLEEFAREAVTFTNCRSNAPRTLRSYLSQLSGLYSDSHFVEDDSDRRWRPPVEKHQLAPNRWTLPEALRAAGWTTTAWVDNPWLVNGIGIRQGFDLYNTSASDLPHWGDRFDPDGGIRHILPQVDRWLDDLPSGAAPFVFVQVLDVHGPYIPVEPWKGTFRGDEWYDETHREPVAGELVDVFGMVPTYIARGVYPDGDIPDSILTGPLHAAYDEKILELDAELGHFFDSLKESGFYDRSIIVFSADHGESLLDHDFYFGHGTLHGESLDVPLIVRLPGGERGGERVDTPVQLVDLYPTVAELAGLPANSSGHGRSLAAALRGARLDPKPLFAEGGVMKQFAIEYEGWKLIESWPSEASFQTMLTHRSIDQAALARVPALMDAIDSNRKLRRFFEENPERLRDLGSALQGPFYELYHLAEDPTELNNLAEEHPERLAELLELMRSERERIEASRALAEPLAMPVEFSESDISRLRDLGYLEGDELDEASSEDGSH